MHTRTLLITPFCIYSYWLGSQATGQPIYQYRLILPFDDKVVNVATDMDFNIEAEIKCPISANLSTKTNFTVGSNCYNLVSSYVVMYTRYTVELTCVCFGVVLCACFGC
jgi:hypothetical protein